MKLIINNHEYDVTQISTAESITLVHKTVEEMVQAYTDFRTAESFVLDDTTYTGRAFTGANLLESGGNIQATYMASGIDPVMQDKANGYDILTGGM